jgi:hypothetical protein
MGDWPPIEAFAEALRRPESDRRRGECDAELPRFGAMRRHRW